MRYSERPEVRAEWFKELAEREAELIAWADELALRRAEYHMHEARIQPLIEFVWRLHEQEGLP